MRKIFYSLGAVAAVATPIIATVSCGSDDANKETKTVVQTTPVQKEEVKPTFDDITIDVRIPDFDKQEKFDEAKFNTKDFIDFYTSRHRRINGESVVVTTHSMMPYHIDREIKVPSTGALTLGGLMDELNKTGEIFKFNMDIASAGEMGRFLMGVKKSDEELATVKDLSIESWWAIHYEDNGHGDIIMQNEWNHPYISLSSPTSKLAVPDSHIGFDNDESLYGFDQRLPKGVDGINLASHDVFYLNLWKMA